MKAIVLTSTAFRHQYFAENVAEFYEVVGVLVEKKANYYAEQRDSSPIIRTHFDRIAEAETRWLAPGGRSLPFVFVPDMNSDDSLAWALAQKPDVVCLFGTTILGGAWLNAFPDRIVNLHLGLSPFYRGSATLFWPFVNRELQFLGTTIHVASNKVDAGNILLRIEADLRPREDYYEITSRLIRDSIRAFPGAVYDFSVGKLDSFPQEVCNGRFYRKNDFNEDRLLMVLDYVGGGLDDKEIVRIQKAKECRCLP